MVPDIRYWDVFSAFNIQYCQFSGTKLPAVCILRRPIVCAIFFFLLWVRVTQSVIPSMAYGNNGQKLLQPAFAALPERDSDSQQLNSTRRPNHCRRVCIGKRSGRCSWCVYADLGFQGSAGRNVYFQQDSHYWRDQVPSSVCANIWYPLLTQNTGLSICSAIILPPSSTLSGLGAFRPFHLLQKNVPANFLLSFFLDSLIHYVTGQLFDNFLCGCKLQTQIRMPSLLQNLHPVLQLLDLPDRR